MENTKHGPFLAYTTLADLQAAEGQIGSLQSLEAGYPLVVRQAIADQNMAPARDRDALGNVVK